MDNKTLAPYEIYICCDKKRLEIIADVTFLPKCRFDEFLEYGGVSFIITGNITVNGIAMSIKSAEYVGVNGMDVGIKVYNHFCEMIDKFNSDVACKEELKNAVNMMVRNGHGDVGYDLIQSHLDNGDRQYVH